MLSALKKAFFKENTVKGASLILIVTLALSNILGVFRDHFLASRIPTDRLDIYFAAFRIPDLIFNVLILGSIAAAFVPVYSNYLKEKGREEADKLAQTTMTVGIIILIVSIVLLYFFIPSLMTLLVPSFDIAKRQETISLARWLLISPLFFGFSYFIGGFLNAHKRFLAYSIAPLVYNLSIIAGVLIFSGTHGVGGAVIGVIIGAFLHMAIQIPSLLQVGFKPRFILDFKNEGMQRILKLMVPRAIGLGANQIMLFAFTGFASAFAGGIAIYNFADNIQTVPSVIFGNSFAMAVFPTLAALSVKVKEEKDQFEAYFLKSIKAILFFMIPATVLLIILRAQVIRIILGYGFFGWSDTKTASATLGLFAVGIIAQGLVPLFARSFYAMHDTKTPMYASIIAIITSVLIGFGFSRIATDAVFGISTLALAFSVGSWINLFVLMYKLKSKIDLQTVRVISFVFNVIFITFVMAIAVQMSKYLVASFLDIDRVRFLAVQILVALGVGLGSYLGLAWIFKFEEIRK